MSAECSSSIDTTSTAQLLRYAKYTADADFDDFTQTTLATLIGKMKIGDTQIELPAQLEYLREDSDADGLSLNGLLTSTGENLLQTKWHVWLADYQGCLFLFCFPWLCVWMCFTFCFVDV